MKKDTINTANTILKKTEGAKTSLENLNNHGISIIIDGVTRKHNGMNKDSNRIIKDSIFLSQPTLMKINTILELSTKAIEREIQDEIAALNKELDNLKDE